MKQSLDEPFVPFSHLFSIPLVSNSVISFTQKHNIHQNFLLSSKFFVYFPTLSEKKKRNFSDVRGIRRDLGLFCAMYSKNNNKSQEKVTFLTSRGDRISVLFVQIAFSFLPLPTLGEQEVSEEKRLRAAG